MKMAKAKINLDELTAQMDDLKDSKARYEYEIKEVEKKMAVIELALQTELTRTKKDEMRHGIYYWGYKTTTRNALDQKMLKEKYPEQHAACVHPSSSTKFVFKING